MGLFLLIPGLIFLLNGVDWFDGENTVGLLLVVIGAILLCVQTLIFASVLASTKKVGGFRRW